MELLTTIGTYFVSYGVDNSVVAEQHRNQWEEVCIEKDQERDCHLRSIAAVGGPRNTDSFDDVRAQYTKGRLMNRHEDPDEHDSTIQQALLCDRLQNAQTDPSSTRRSANIGRKCHTGLISLCVDLFVFVCIWCVIVSYCLVVVSL